MNWEIFLTDVSKSVLSSGDLLVELDGTEDMNWLGFPGTTDAEIDLHERRLNTTLPPSYKEFLKTSNGFKQLNCFVWNVLSVQEIQWLKDFDSFFYRLYTSDLDTFNASDEDYFVYGSEQKSINFRSIYLTNSLAVSKWGDASILLLNPDVKFGEEWEAWMFATWNLGPARYQSFEELMKEEYNSYLELLNDTK